VSKRIRIVPLYRDEIDVARLAEALLDFVAGLSDEERTRFLERSRKHKEPKRRVGRKKGSAA